MTQVYWTRVHKHERVREKELPMKIGIIGLPQTGKTTLFGALTRGTTQVSQSKTNLAAVGVADADLDYLSNVFKPKKTTPASVEFADVPGIPVSYTHLRAHETRHDLVCRLLLEKKKKKKT